MKYLIPLILLTGGCAQQPDPENFKKGCYEGKEYITSTTGLGNMAVGYMGFTGNECEAIIGCQEN